MNTDIVGILVIYAGITVIALLVKRKFVRRGPGVLGLIFVLQPAAMTTYRSVDPWVVLGLAVLGVFLLLAATSETTRG